MSSKYDTDFRARVLVDAAYLGDQEAADRHGVSRRSVIRWRNRVADDTELSQAVESKLTKLEQARWVEQIPEALQASISYLRRGAEKGDASDPKMYRAIAGGAQVMGRLWALEKILHAQFGGRGSEGSSEDGEVVSGEFRSLPGTD